MKRTCWSGVFPAITTQMKRDGSLDLDATARHAGVLIESGVSGIIFLGSLGENQVMTADVETVPVSLPLRRLMDLFYVHQNRARHQGYPVVDDAGRLVSMVTRSDLPELSERNELGWLVTADVMSTRQTVVAWPEEPLSLSAAV